MRWRLNPHCKLHWRRWDNDHVLFNAASGQTHFLNELGALTLQLLSQQALDGQTLIQALADHFDDFVLDEELLGYVDTMLEDLDNLGLIEPAP